jgi:NADH-quinone oxidoreductase subunit G
MEITTYLERAMGSELQGNIIDLCPVGALTSKPYEFHARPWELVKTESIDVMDAVGSAIRVDTRGREVMRILPRLNEAVNEEWISDKTRFIWDGLRTQRLDRPYIRKRGRLVPSTWSEAFTAIAARVKKAKPKEIGAIAGDLATVEEMFALKGLMEALGSPNIDGRQDGAAIDPAAGRAGYIFNPTIAGIEQADIILIVGSDPRHEAAVLNARIRKRWRTGEVRVGLIGEQVDLTYPVDYLGAGPESLAEIAAGNGEFGKLLAAAKRPLVVVGQGALARADGKAVLALAARIATSGTRDEGWNGLAVLHTAAARVGGLDIGFVPGKGGLDVAGMVKSAGDDALDTLFLLGADEIDVEALGKTFVVYIGTHGDAGAHRADVILPGAAYTEKSGTFVNTEGRVQLANRAGFPPGDARQDWAILRAMSDTLDHRLPYDSLSELRSALYKAFPHLARIDEIKAGSLDEVKALGAAEGAPSKEPFRKVIADYYLTNPIARASAVMAECSAIASARLATAAE